MGVLLKALDLLEAFEMEVECVIQVGRLILAVELANLLDVLLCQVGTTILVFFHVNVLPFELDAVFKIMGGHARKFKL